MSPTHVDMNIDLESVFRIVYLTHGQLIVLDKSGKPVESFNNLYASGIGAKLSQYYWQKVIAAAKYFCIASVIGNPFTQELSRSEFEKTTNSRFIFADGPLAC